MTTPHTHAAGGQAAVKTDDEALRRVGEAMHSHAAALQRLTKALSQLPPSADAASVQFISHHAPKEVYHDAVTALKALNDRFQTETDHAYLRLSEKADALRAAATSHDSTEDDSAKAMTKVDGNGVAPHGGTSHTPAPTTGDKPVTI